MPYNWNRDFIPSKADKSTDILGQKEIGGVGQLIYHPFRYRDYILTNDREEYCAFPVCRPGYEPDFPANDSVSGKGLLVSLCNLARQIDDWDNKIPYDQLIIQWCKENMHPYNIDFVYGELTEDSFDITGYDAELAARDSIFAINDFMKDLGALYTTALFYEALEGICVANEDAAYDLYREGKYFEGLPFFESFKGIHSMPDVDVSQAGGSLVKEMQIYAEYRKSHPEEQPPDGQFVTEPYDDYGNLLNKLIERIPDFNMRLKINPKTNRIEFSADVNSVFDIAWFTLARMISEDPAPENKGKSEDRAEDIMICCRHCGAFLIRRNGRQEYCDKPDCQKARNAKNQREFRRRKRIKNAQNQKKNTAKT